MQKSAGIFLISLCIAMIYLAGCTGTGPANATQVATPTPQIIYVTVLVTPTPATNPETPAVTPEVTAPARSQEIGDDEEFIDYIDNNKIIEGMTALTSASPGAYSISTGYNSASRSEATRLTDLLIKSPIPGSEKVKMYRSAMMDALSMMDGSTAGFSRYRDAMQTVILERNDVLSEMHSLGSAAIDAKHFSGQGNDGRWYNTTEAGLKTFSMHHTGDRNFAITLKDEDGKYISLLVNEIGDYSGKKSERLAAGAYYLEITADGEWTIGITTE
jgi:hypothetical protein